MSSDQYATIGGGHDNTITDMAEVPGTPLAAVGIGPERLTVALWAGGKRGDWIDVTPLPDWWTGSHTKVMVLGNHLAVTTGWDVGAETETPVVDYIVSIDSILDGKADWQLVG